MTFCQLLASSCLYVAHSLALMIATTRLSHCSMLPPLVAPHELNDFFSVWNGTKSFKSSFYFIKLHMDSYNDYQLIKGGFCKDSVEFRLN